MDMEMDNRWIIDKYKIYRLYMDYENEKNEEMRYR